MCRQLSGLQQLTLNYREPGAWRSAHSAWPQMPVLRALEYYALFNYGKLFPIESEVIEQFLEHAAQVQSLTRLRCAEIVVSEGRPICLGKHVSQLSSLMSLELALMQRTCAHGQCTHRQCTHGQHV